MENIREFLGNAQNKEFLAQKVALIMGVTGACRGKEICQIDSSKLSDYKSFFLVKIPFQSINPEVNPKISDINNKVNEELQKLQASKIIKQWESKVLGGGRIKHDPDAKTINVYGYSQGYGKADHKVSVEILKTKYPDYNITASDEGY